MRYHKILDVSEDDSRVYFTFYNNDKSQRIIGIPKKLCVDKAIYAGTTFSSLTMVDSDRAGVVLNELMKKVLLGHPAIESCNLESLKLIT